MQFLARRPDSLDEICLHEAVNVLVFRCDFKRAALQVFKNARQALLDLFFFITCQNSLGLEHRNMGDAPGNILFI